MKYYKVRMKGSFTYHAYVAGIDKKEAREMVKYELLDDEQDDIIDAIIEISEDEYNNGYENFHNGTRE